MGAARGHLWGPLLQRPFPRSPREARGQPDSGQVAWTAWTPGELPAGSCWPRRRGPEPATGPASGVIYKQDDCHPQWESQPCLPILQATPSSWGCWPVLGGGQGRTGTVGQPRGPQPRPRCKQSLGLEEGPPLSTSRDPDCGFQILQNRTVLDIEEKKNQWRLGCT